MALNKNKNTNINKSTSLGIPSIFFKNRGILNFNQLTVIPKSNNYKNKEQFFNKNSSIYSEKMNYRIKRTVLANQRENTEQQLRFYNIENKKRKINENEEKNSIKKLCVEDIELNINQNKSFRTDSSIKKDLFANLDFNRSIDKEFILRDEGFLQNPRLFENSFPSKSINMKIIENNKVNTPEKKYLEIVSKPVEEYISEDKVINLNLTTNMKSPAINYKTKSINQLLSQIDNHRLTFSKKTHNLSSNKIYQKRFEDIKLLLSNGLCNKEYKEITNETSSRVCNNTYLGETVNSNLKYGVNNQTFNIEKLKSLTENKSDNVSHVNNTYQNTQNDSFKAESKENFNNIGIPKINSFENNESKLNTNVMDSQKAANFNNLSNISVLNNDKIPNLKETNVKFEFSSKPSNIISFDNLSKSDSEKVILEGNKNCKVVNNLPNDFPIGNSVSNVNRKNCSEVESLSNNSFGKNVASEISSSSSKFTLANPPLNNASLDLPTSNVFGNVSKTGLSQIPSSNLGFEKTVSLGKSNLDISSNGSSLSQPQISFSESNSRACTNAQTTSNSLIGRSIENTELFDKDNLVLNSNKPDIVKSLNNFPIKTCPTEVFSSQKNDSNSSKTIDFKLNLPTNSELSNSIPTSSIKQLEPGFYSNLQSKISIFEPKKSQESVLLPATSVSKIGFETHNQGITGKNNFSFGASNSNNNTLFGQSVNKAESKHQESSNNYTFGASNSNNNTVFGQSVNKAESKQQQPSNNYTFGASNSNNNTVFGQSVNKPESKNQEPSNKFPFGKSNPDSQQQLFRVETQVTANNQVITSKESSNNFSFGTTNSNSNTLFGQSDNKPENKPQEPSNNYTFGASNSNSNTLFGQSANKPENKPQEPSNNYTFGASNSISNTVFGQSANKPENKSQEPSNNYTFGASNSNGNTLFGQSAYKSDNKPQESSNNFTFGAGNSNSTTVFGQSANKSENKPQESSNNFTFGKSNSNSQQLFRVESQVAANNQVITSKGSSNNFSFGVSSSNSNTVFGQSVNKPENKPQEPSNNYTFGASNSNSNTLFGQSANKSENKPQESSNNFTFGKSNSNSQQLFRVEPRVTTSNVFSNNLLLDQTVNKSTLPKNESVAFLNTISSSKNDSNANIFNQLNNQPTSIFKNQNASNPSHVITSQNNCNDSNLNIFSQSAIPNSFSFGNKPVTQNSEFSKNTFNFSNKK